LVRAHGAPEQTKFNRQPKANAGSVQTESRNKPCMT
jgi:hypothetical protein